MPGVVRSVTRFAMVPAAAKAEELFAQALEVPASARRRFLSERCAHDDALRREIESLIAAHESAGDFLQAPATSGASPSVPSTVVLQPPAATSNPAVFAENFLRASAGGTHRKVEDFLAGVPSTIRQEVAERIAAGLRVRELRLKAGGPGHPPEVTPPLLPGFHLERKLGEGSLGAVYLARDEKLGRQVALKVIRRPGQDEVRRRVLDEARKAAALADPAVVTIYSVLDEADPPALVMEYVEGFPLDRFAAQLNFPQKAGLLREVARALAVAHERGLLHRDLKPDNVIVGPDMRPRILDFGLALSLEEAARLGGGFEGTPLYASPEQVRSLLLTTASDVFSFGSLMFKVLTGRHPFAGETVEQVLEAIATTAPPFLREVAVGVPEDLQAICLACFAWNPADRPSAAEVGLELGRFLLGEPVRLKPKLYDDLLRQSISEYSARARTWESQSIISPDDRDALEIVHRRLLAGEDHWIIDARRITLLQTILSGATWLSVVATVLTVWMLRDELGASGRWLWPTFFTATLFLAGYVAQRQKEKVAAATFLAGAALSLAPCMLAWLAQMRVMAVPPTDVTQLFSGSFTNQQVAASSLAALAFSVVCLARLQITGFAWTTAAQMALGYLSILLLFDWLGQKPELQALWCLPLASAEFLALALEHRGRVRWTLPFQIVALLALVGSLDVMALNGPTLKMLGVDETRWPYFDHSRLLALSFVFNGLFFLALMLLTERSASLDLRRASKLLEVLAIVHTLSALFANAMAHRGESHIRADVWLYVVAAGLFMVLAPFRSRWRLLVGGLAGCGLGSYLLVELGLVARKPFIIGSGLVGLVVALGTFFYVRLRSRAKGPKPAPPQVPAAATKAHEPRCKSR
jgi:serine/threonine protein kinase